MTTNEFKTKHRNKEFTTIMKFFNAMQSVVIPEDEYTQFIIDVDMITKETGQE